MNRDEPYSFAGDAPERDEGGDLMPEGMDADAQRDTRSAAEKIAGALEFAVQAQADTPDKFGQMGK